MKITFETDSGLKGTITDDTICFEPCAIYTEKNEKEYKEICKIFNFICEMRNKND